MNFPGHTHSEDTSELWSSYLDGALDVVERRQAEMLLQSCPGCAADLADLRSLKTALATLPAPMPRRSFTLDPSSVRPRRRLFPIFRWATLASALLLFVVLGIDAISSSGMSVASQAGGATGGAAQLEYAQRGVANSETGAQASAAADAAVEATMATLQAPAAGDTGAGAAGAAATAAPAAEAAEATMEVAAADEAVEGATSAAAGAAGGTMPVAPATMVVLGAQVTMGATAGAADMVDQATAAAEQLVAGTTGGSAVEQATAASSAALKVETSQSAPGVPVQPPTEPAGGNALPEPERQLSQTSSSSVGTTSLEPPANGVAPSETSSRVSALRALQIGLATLTLGLGLATWWSARRHL